MCHCGKGLLEQVKAATLLKPVTAIEVAEQIKRPVGSVHPALNVLVHTGQARRYAQIMNGKPGRPRVVYQAMS